MSPAVPLREFRAAIVVPRRVVHPPRDARTSPAGAEIVQPARSRAGVGRRAALRPLTQLVQRRSSPRTVPIAIAPRTREHTAPLI